MKKQVPTAMIDYHLHTARCGHAEGTPAEYLRQAAEIGLTEIGFADHFPLGMLGYTPRSKVTMEPQELEDYIADVEALRNNGAGVKVKLGIEVDYLPGKEGQIEELLARYPFDYVIGSVHFLGDWDFTHPRYAGVYGDRDIGDLYNTYFLMVSNLCRSGLFDIVGHIDVIKKFGYRPETGLAEIWENMASLLSDTGTCYELNTAGRDAPVGDFYPDRGFVEACFKREVKITLGSDAHNPGQVGRYLPDAVDLLREVGYREITLFSRRVRDSFSI